jgi:hypothetical protein
MINQMPRLRHMRNKQNKQPVEGTTRLRSRDTLPATCDHPHLNRLNIQPKLVASLETIESRCLVSPTTVESDERHHYRIDLEPYQSFTIKGGAHTANKHPDVVSCVADKRGGY